MPSFNDLNKAIENYIKKYRREDVPKLSLGPGYDLFPDEGQPSMECELHWPQTWPNCNDAGIYAFIDRNLNIIYIGKSSMNSSLGARLAKYCGYGENKNCRFKHDTWSVQPRYIWTVSVPEEIAFEASALEEYLIKVLKPSDNSIGK